jgi:hypothetical protein
LGGDFGGMPADALRILVLLWFCRERERERGRGEREREKGKDKKL